MNSFDASAFDSIRYDPEEVYDPNEDLARADVGFTGPDVETDQDAIAEAVFGRLAELVPNWQAHDGNPDVWLVEAFAAIGSEIRTLVSYRRGSNILFPEEMLSPFRPVPFLRSQRFSAGWTQVIAESRLLLRGSLRPERWN